MSQLDAVIGTLPLDPVLRVESGSSLRVVAEAMEDAVLGCALVGSGAARVVTEHDLAGALAAGLRPESPIDEVATPHPTWVTTTSTLADALSIMVTHHIRHLLVVHPDGEAAGFLSLGVATKTLLEEVAPSQKRQSLEGA